VFHLALRDKEPVERVAMEGRKRCNRNRVLGRNRQWLEAPVIERSRQFARIDV
jgi:hypothetical protein